MKQEATSTDFNALPDRVRSLFWDYDAETLNGEIDRDFIIRRVLTLGDWEAVCWLRARLGDAALRTWIMHQRGAGLSPRQLRFWELILDLPPDEVTAWIDAAHHSVWERRTAP